MEPGTLSLPLFAFNFLVLDPIREPNGVKVGDDNEDADRFLTFGVYEFLIAEPNADPDLAPNFGVC